MNAPSEPGLLDLPAWRSRILDRVFRWTAVAALLPCLAGVWLAIEAAVWPLAVLDLTAWVVVVGVALARRMPYPVRATIAVAVFGAVGTGVLAMTGPYGVGLLWLVAVPSLAGVLASPRMFWLAEAGVLLALASVGGLVWAGGLSWPVSAVSWTWWVMAWTSLLCVSLLVGLSTSTMMQGLQHSLATMRSDRQALARANLTLQEEIRARREAEQDREVLQRQLVLAQKMEAVGQLAGGFAHDLNNILTVIRLEAYLAQSSVEPGSEAADSLENLLSATESASVLCNKLLLFARQRPSSRTVVALDEQLAAFEPLLTRLVGERIQLSLELGAQGTRVLLEPVELEQVMVNLLANARDAMPEGGRIRIGTHPVVDDEGLRVRIEVMDEGVGMDAATLDRVFEPFFTTKPEGLGTGLGLATVYAIVKSLGGTVEAHSTPGLGSSFRLLLPTAEQASAPPVLRVLPSTHMPSLPPRVLVVEDQPAVRSVVERVLEQLGCMVSSVGSVDEALAWLASQEEPPSLVLTDIVMPNATGVELAETVLVRYPTVKLLGMSGWMSDSELSVRLHKLGVPIVRKPFTPDELARAVAERLARRAANGD